MNWIGQYIRLEKLNANDLKEIVIDSKNYGLDAPGALPIGYWITGKLLVEPIVGEWLSIDRDSRNGKSVRGVLNTSVIKDIDEVGGSMVITTQNSMYVMRKIEEEQS